MEQDSTMTAAGGMAPLFAGDAWFDPIEAGIRERMRGSIGELLEQELTAALGGRGRHEGAGGGARAGGAAGGARAARAGGRRAEGPPERDAGTAAHGQLRAGAARRAEGAH